MDKLESLEKYFITPNVNFYGGYTHNGKDILLCDDTDEDPEYEYKIHIVDMIKNNVLIKDIEKSYKMRNGKKVTQKEHQEIELDDGQLLIYVEGNGFIISEYKMVTIDEAKARYDLLKSPNKEE
jgi:hypothetical protein